MLRVEKWLQISVVIRCGIVSTRSSRKSAIVQCSDESPPFLKFFIVSIAIFWSLIELSTI